MVLAVACTSATVTPEPTVAPSPTVTPEHGQAGLTALDLASADAFAELEKFLEELGPRESATAQEAVAAEYLQDRFQESGYETEIQRFTIEDLALAGMGLRLDLPDPEEFAALPLERSGLGDVSGILTPVGLAMPGDLPDGGLEGRIAFAKRGVITFQAKAENVFAAGAVGLVIYNNVFGPFRGVLATQPDFPVISISRNDGEAIEDLLADSEIEALITLTTKDLPSQNVIAEKKGPGESVVVLGGHYDSVPGIAGANDNASGAAVLVTLARMLADVDLPFTIRIVPFGSEELGLLGSRFYVESLSENELENTKAMLNFDALGTGSGVSVFGDGDITALVSDIGDQVNVDVAVTLGLRGGSSDFASFREAGVPYLMFFGDDVSRIHTERDTLEFVQAEMLGGAAAVAAALLQSQEFADLIASR
ncbi:MAG: M20/M25/M40 family metallo-hydrolase [SAR202 cluster bacterium]|nr:M20/M25/M40 family metallo-hydrolase [SAR202 cluster bacterium]